MAGLALFDMLYSKIINMKRMELKTLQTAINYDPRLEVDMISDRQTRVGGERLVLYFWSDLNKAMKL